MYYVVNTTRMFHTRTARALSAARHRTMQRVCGGLRVPINRPMPLPDALFEQYKESLEEKERAGMIRVHVDSPKGPRAFGEAAPPPAKKEEPEPEEEESVELEEEEEELEEELEEEEAAPPEPDKPIEKMNKAELVTYAAEVLGEDEDDLGELTMAQIKARLS